MRGETDRGISPVIGVVLVVAMVVVLSATVAVYVLDFGDQRATQAPQMAIVAEYSERTSGNGEYLNLSFESGETLDKQNLSLVVSGARDSGGTAAPLTGDPLGTQAPTRITSGIEITMHAGHFDAVDPAAGEHLDLSEATLRLVWKPTDAGDADSYVIYRWPEPSRR
ncbi:type IV pilin [Haloarcula amylovorans]|uniref:type IV pilin n=1 Tax=Haloarcula amylovorans TaxID=2562280 RepID=UPI001FD72A6D|nr:type IV pilin N-terminal domain-containing protein [Halomicroarcula amylolytica]